MDKIWDRNPLKSEGICRCDGNEKTEWPRETANNRIAKKKNVYVSVLVNNIDYK